MNTIEIIAEIGQNHNGDMDIAKKLIQAAKEVGADVAKFQLYDAKALFPQEGNPWYEYNLSTEISKTQLIELYQECQKYEIEFMASVFDVERIQWLEELNVKRYKIASRSIHDETLIHHLEQTNKPLIASLGYWTKKHFPNIKSSKVDYLYCISKYPTDLSDLKFSHVDFTQYSGFSDHTLGIAASQIAMSRGARIIEKHLTLDKSMYGPDHLCSMNIDELAQLCVFRDQLLSSM